MDIKNKIKSCLPQWIIRKRWQEKNGSNPKIWGEVCLQDEIDKNGPLFLPNYGFIGRKEKERLVADITDCYLLYGATPNEYFMFGFHRCHDKAFRRSCLTVKQKDLLCLALPQSDEALREMTDKALFHRLTAEYFKRDALAIRQPEDEDAFHDFYVRHEHFIVKPLEGQCGIGTFICGHEENAKETFVKICNMSGGVIIEELIQQAKETAAFNASSVNTVRLPSIYNASGQTILQPFFRTGRRGQVVDNGGSGGVFAAIDPLTGRLISDGVDELGHRYTEHPDSHIVYKGWQVPKWQELVELSREIHRSLLPVNKYIGFDFALTESGWVLVEGNWGQFVGQYATGMGVRGEFERLMREP